MKTECDYYYEDLHENSLLEHCPNCGELIVSHRLGHFTLYYELPGTT